MKKLFKIVLVSIIPLVLFSCYYDEFPEEIVQDDVVIDPDTVVSFADDIAPIFATYNCTHLCLQDMLTPVIAVRAHYTFN